MALVVRGRRRESTVHPLHSCLWPLDYMSLVLLLIYQLRAVWIVHVKLRLRLKHQLLLIEAHLLLFGIHLVNSAMLSLPCNHRVQTLLRCG